MQSSVPMRIGLTNHAYERLLQRFKMLLPAGCSQSKEYAEEFLARRNLHPFTRWQDSPAHVATVKLKHGENQSVYVIPGLMFLVGYLIEDGKKLVVKSCFPKFLCYSP